MAFGNLRFNRPPPPLRRVGACALATAALAGCDAEAPTSSLWDGAAIPAVAAADDPNPAGVGVKFRSVGVKFRSDVDGRITGLRFYKGPQNTGTHIGNIWSASGERLASVTFADETPGGWQRVELAEPVAITANNTYVASYHAPSGFYSVDQNYFVSPLTNGPLTASPDSRGGGNGVFVYAPSSAFPSETFNASNYWVDVIFEAATPAPAVRNFADRPIASARP